MQCMDFGCPAPVAHIDSCLCDGPCTGHLPFPGSFSHSPNLLPSPPLKTICPQVLVSESDGTQIDIHHNNPKLSPTTTIPIPNRRMPLIEPLSFPLTQWVPHIRPHGKHAGHQDDSSTFLNTRKTTFTFVFI